MDYKAFVDSEKSLLVAPAGYGKTFTIVECLKYTSGKQLILTHTHAGVAAIKEKIKKTPDIKSSQYRIETISSFAQKYVKAFYAGDDMPRQELSQEYHKFIIEQAIHIFGTSSVQEILSASYSGLFVDEYQDCNVDHHSMVEAISNVLPTHILGDYLQGIFGFEDGALLVDFDKDLNSFDKFPNLEIPYRWYQEGNNSPLGDHLKTIRELLETNQDITLEAKDSIGFHVIVVGANDIWEPSSKYRKGLNKLIRNPERRSEYDSLLIVSPEYSVVEDDGKKRKKGNIWNRAKLVKQLNQARNLNLLEAIDDKSFYSLSTKADNLISGIVRARNPINRIKNDILLNVFIKSDITHKWFNDKALVQKTNDDDRANSNKLKKLLDGLILNPSLDQLFKILKFTKIKLKSKYKREGVSYSFMKALEQAILCNTSVYDAMIVQRNIIRRYGRKITGKCLGTTLLTKGLEFDTVAILDAHKFDCPKHLYVAITRACKKLVIFTENTTLSPYTNMN